MRKKILALMLTVMIGSAQVMTVSAAKTTDELEQQKAQTTAQLNETQSSINDLEAKKDAITSQIGDRNRRSQARLENWMHSWL